MFCEIRDLNDLKGGFENRWYLKDENENQNIQAFLQKISHSIEDFNSEIKCNCSFRAKDIVFVIVLATWIQEAVKKIENCIKESCSNAFVYPKASELNYAEDYLLALRSFTVAHPLSTDRHKRLGFDGDKVCVDINAPCEYFDIKSDEVFYHFSFDGLEAGRCADDDYLLYIYSKKENRMEFSRHIGCSIVDLIRVVELYVDKVYALDDYLYKHEENAAMVGD